MFTNNYAEFAPRAQNAMCIPDLLMLISGLCRSFRYPTTYKVVSLRMTSKIDSKVEKTNKRELESVEDIVEQPVAKCTKYDPAQHGSRFSDLSQGKNRLIPKHIFDKLTEDEIKLIENVRTSCIDLGLIQEAIKVRKKHRLTIRLPEDMEDSEYYIENGLRKVYPYPYLFQSYAKRRWKGRKLKDVLKQEFRDISDEQLKVRFDAKRILVNGEPCNFDHILRDNHFVLNRNHRHELPVLAAPIKVIYEDKDTLVVDKPPSVPIHPCGRYRHNSVISILAKENKYSVIKVVHRLDRLVSGVLIIARSTGRANALETMIKNRDVQKEYVCRVVGEFPLGLAEDDGFVTVDQPLDLIEGKIGVMVCHPEGKECLTKFKRLNYNGKTSSVLCRPETGRMHQIRVHLQYLGHPIVNDSLYNSDAFGPERGKGARYAKTFRQISQDVIALHRASSWLITEDSDMIDPSELHNEPREANSNAGTVSCTRQESFLNEEEREETMAALGHYFTNESWKDMEEKCKFDPEKLKPDPSCRDCSDKFYDPPLRRLYLYLHALRYSGTGWCYESEMPTWARDTWSY